MVSQKATADAAQAEGELQRQLGEAAAEEVERLPWLIGDFYRGRCVLLTGGSGFVGRVLLEKLLRSCPDLDTVYMLLRPRKGLSPQERFLKLTSVPLFDKLRESQPDALSKVQLVQGDASAPGLGLSADDVQTLTERVSIVLHLAASVRFDDPLEFALRINVRSTRDLVGLALRMKQLKAFVHVSTTFCNLGEDVYDEQLYPVSADWRSLLDAVDKVDPVHFRILTAKILGDFCNTYTFTKNLAEHLLSEYADRLPIAILRPSVVVATATDPIPGWIDNFNGPVGLLIGAGKGVVHTGWSGPDKYIDYIPCDITVKGIIVCSCATALKGPGKISVYHGAQSNLERVTQADLINMAIDMDAVLPFKETLYHPCGGVTSHFWLFYLQFILFQLLPAFFVDAALIFKGKKPFLTRLQRRIYTANMAVSWFTMQDWNFVNKRFLELEKKLMSGDLEEFAYKVNQLDSRTLFFKAFHGARLYLLNEPDSDIPKAKRSYLWKRVLHYVLKTSFYVGVTWFLLSRIYFLVLLIWRYCLLE